MTQTIDSAADVVRQYQERRPFLYAFSGPIVNSITPKEFQEAQRRTGIEWDPDDTSLFARNAMDVLVETCLFNLWTGGKTVLTRFAEANPLSLDTFSGRALQAWLDSHFSKFEVERTEPGTFVWLRDMLYGGELVRLVDVSASLTAPVGGQYFAQDLDLDEIAGTVGTLLPVNGVDVFSMTSGGADYSTYTAEQFAALSPEARSGLNIDMVRAAIGAGAARGTLQVEDAIEKIRQEAPFRQTQRLTSARSIGRNDPCPCGSGKKYKKCCSED